MSTTAQRLEFFTADQAPGPLQVLRLDDPDMVNVLPGLPDSGVSTPPLRLNPSSWKPELIVTCRQPTLIWWTRHRRAKIEHRLDLAPRKNGDWNWQLGNVDVEGLWANRWVSPVSWQLAAEAIERYVNAQLKKSRNGQGASAETVHLEWVARTSWMMYRLLTLGIAELLKQTPRPAHVKVNLNLRYVGHWDRARTAACNHLIGAGLLEKEVRYFNSWLLSTDPLQIPDIVALLGLDMTEAAPEPSATPTPALHSRQNLHSLS